jgi:putative heme-binding domain-containing protein
MICSTLSIATTCLAPTLDPAAIAGVDLGRTQPKSGGTAGWFAEFRVWQVARNAAQIRESFDRTFAGGPRPPALVHVFAGDTWGPLQGRARVGVTDDVPALLTAAEAAVQQEKFARFRTLANARGNPDQGKLLFTGLCLTCHQHRGQGGQIAPALDGVGNSGTDALLRHILTPSAAMESAYRTYRIVARDGTVHEGFLADDTPAAVVLRTPGAEDRRFPRAEIKSAAYLSRSLMPEGLLDALPSEQVTDLFAHLKSLR